MKNERVWVKYKMNGKWHDGNNGNIKTLIHMLNISTTATQKNTLKQQMHSDFGTQAVWTRQCCNTVHNQTSKLISTLNRDSFLDSLHPARPSLFVSQSAVNGPSIPDDSLKLHQIIHCKLHFTICTKIERLLVSPITALYMYNKKCL